jgi:hypothetical protein
MSIAAAPALEMRNQIDRLWSSMPSVVTWSQASVKHAGKSHSKEKFEHNMQDCAVCMAGEAKAGRHGSGYPMKPSMVTWVTVPCVGKSHSKEKFEHNMQDCAVCMAGEAKAGRHESGYPMKPSK